MLAGKKNGVTFEEIIDNFCETYSVKLRYMIQENFNIYRTRNYIDTKIQKNYNKRATKWIRFL